MDSQNPLNGGRNRRNVLRVIGKAAAAGTAVAVMMSGSAKAAGRHGGDRTPLCLLRGTQVETDRGGVAVEDLKIGDRVRTQDGDFQPVKWVGHRSYQRTPDRHWWKHVDPVRVQRSALADNVPSRDLYLSPAHALFIDGHLIAAHLLVNGTTIAQGMFDGDRIDYFHVECESHQVIFAEGAAVETLRSEAVIESFANFAERERLYGPALPTKGALYAPEAGYDGIGEHAAALARQFASAFVDLRDPVQVAYDRLAARARAMAFVA